MTTTADLATDLGVDEGDVDVLLNQLGESEQELSDDLAGSVRRVQDPHGERTAVGAGSMSATLRLGSDNCCGRRGRDCWHPPACRDVGRVQVVTGQGEPRVHRGEPARQVGFSGHGHMAADLAADDGHVPVARRGDGRWDTGLAGALRLRVLPAA